MNNVDEAIKVYNDTKLYKDLVANIDTDFFLKFAETILQAYTEEKEKREKLEKEKQELIKKLEEDKTAVIHGAFIIKEKNIAEFGIELQAYIQHLIAILKGDKHE